MARPKGGLGKGLDSLFADLPEAEAGDAQITALPLREIEPDPDQPRKHFDEEALAQLARSITENGLLQPIAVRPKKAGPGYIIIAGERRWRAARQAGLAEVPVTVREVSDQQAAELALIENLQREDLDPLEAAEGYQQLMQKYDLTQETAAKKLGKSRSALANSLRLLELPQSVREQVRTGALSAGHAKALLGLPNAQSMEAAAQQILGKNLNVRQAEALCRRLTKPPKAQRATPDAFQPPKLAAETEAALREVLGTEVHVAYQDGRGTLEVAFYSDAQLSQFAALLGRYDPQ
jgi:ParB family chromosome partitioning protein